MATKNLPQNNTPRNIFTTQTLLYAIMLLALAGSISHLAKVYASIDQNLTLGYLQALALAHVT